jgi:hypothetical protein
MPLFSSNICTPLPGCEMQRRGAVVVPDVDELGETPAKLRQQRVSGTDISSCFLTASPDLMRKVTGRDWD